MSISSTVQLVSAFTAMGHASKRRAVPRSTYPMLLEVEYGTKLAGVAKQAIGAYDKLAAMMPRLLTTSALDFARHDAGETDFAMRLLKEARAQATSAVTPAQTAQIASVMSGRLSNANRASLAKELKAGLGLDVPINDARASLLTKHFISENVQLIGSIPEDLHQDVANLTMRAFSKRMSPETFAAELQKLADITEGRARAIARDQMGTLNGQLTEARHRELGITDYFWMTRRDPRVRPVHRAREGRKFSYDNAPQGGHPGIDFGCRCVSKPDLSGVIAAINAQRSHASPVG